MLQLIHKSGLIFTILYLVLFLLSTITRAHAHEYWVSALDPKDGIVKALIGYGHKFPQCDPIAEDRLHLFLPLELVTHDGLLPMEQAGENYAYQKRLDIKKRTYMVIGSCEPSFWSKGPGGWKEKDRLQRPDATHVREAIKCAKTILNVQGASNLNLVSKPVGQRLEIVPRVNPAIVGVGDSFPVQVLYEGKPVKTACVEATFSGFSDKGYMAFKGNTDLKGRISIIPLKPGLWIAKVKHTVDYPDKLKADKIVMVSTLTFNINLKN